MALDLCLIFKGLRNRFWSRFNLERSSILEWDFTILCLLRATPSKAYEVVVNKVDINHFELGWSVAWGLVAPWVGLGTKLRLRIRTFGVENMLCFSRILMTDVEFMGLENTLDSFKDLTLRLSRRSADLEISLSDGGYKDSSIK